MKPILKGMLFLFGELMQFISTSYKIPYSSSKDKDGILI
jgi:hypothetical protein